MSPKMPIITSRAIGAYRNRKRNETGLNRSMVCVI
jgi:hypothetical protein